MEISFIKTTVGKLSKEWFIQKKAFFKKETFYSDVSNAISHQEARAISFSDEIGNVYEDIEDLNIVLTLEEYCWNDYYPNSISTQENLGEKLPANASGICLELFYWINSYIDKSHDNTTSYKIVLDTLSKAEQEIEELILLNSNDAEYNNVLRYFISKFKKEVSRRYGYIKILHQFSENTKIKDRLVFDLKQEELIALLYVLDKAKIINCLGNDSSFLKFGRDHFYFRNQRQGNRYTQSSELLKKYSDVQQKIKTRDTKAITYILDRLEDAIQQIRKIIK